MKQLEPVSPDWQPPRSFEAPGAFDGSAGCLVPGAGSFDAFTRLFHPAWYTTGQAVTWRALAQRRERVWHPSVQFHHLGGEEATARLGNLGEQGLTRLAEVLASGGPSTGADCVLGLWEGDRWITEQPAQPVDGAATVSAPAWAVAPRLIRPLRAYRLFRAQLADVPRVGAVLAGVFLQRQPSLVWDEQLSFCVATDPDYDCTIVVSDRAVQEALVADDVLEALPVQASTSLLRDADLLNATGRGG